MTIRQRSLRGGLALGLAAAAGLFLRSGSGGRLLGTMAVASTAAASYDWVQFDFDAQHSGNNTRETAITAANAGSLRRLFQVRLPAVADGAPVTLSAVATSAGTQDLLFVTTKAGHIAALDAHTGALIWMQQYPAGSCRINNNGGRCYTTSSPAIDPNRQYVYSYGLDGYVHRLRVGDGMEITGGGWPELASLKPYNEKGSSPLCVVTTRNGMSYLYMAQAGYPGDRGDYQGHVTVISLADGSQRVFNTNSSDQAVHFVERPGMPDSPGVQSAIWARAAVVYDANTDRIYMATGNGPYDPSQHEWGDTVFALHPDGTGQNGDPLDSYTPVNYRQLDSTDTDLGSTAPAILPVPANSSVKNLALQGGKDSKLRLLDLDNLSGQRESGHTGGEIGQTIRVPQGGEVLTAPAVWVNTVDSSTWAFVANDGGISGLQLTVDAAGTPGLQVVWKKNGGGSSPIVANGVLFYAGSHNMHALEPTTGAELGHDTTIGAIHWESPIVVNGVLYITDESGQLTAYGP